MSIPILPHFVVFSADRSVLRILGKAADFSTRCKTKPGKSREMPYIDEP